MTVLPLAAVLLVALGIAHSVLGERYILRRLFRRDLPRLFGSDVFTKRTLRFAWHLTTVAWCGFVALLLVVAYGVPSRGAILTTVAVTALVSAVVAAAGSRGRHPAWVVFLLVAALAWAAL